MKPDTRTVAATAPYLCWMALMLALPTGAAAYAVRAACCAALLAAYAVAVRPRLRCGASSLALGAAVGLAVFAAWAWPERFGWYVKFFVVGSPGPATAPSAYDPAVCGWPLSLARLAGSAFVIAPAEELFFRSFLYRRLQSRDWTSVDMRRLDFGAFAWTVGLFALEHDRILAGAVAGAAYGLLAVRRGIGAATVAHVVTNFALGAYVIWRGAWEFW